VTQAGHEVEQTAGVLHRADYLGDQPNRRTSGAVKTLHFQNMALINR
jgi:hypothetical protein